MIDTTEVIWYALLPFRWVAMVIGTVILLALGEPLDEVRTHNKEWMEK